jgi:CII-binding regulator of phage lambda lysogenization HflD
MLEISEKIQIVEQLLKNYEADKYSAELNLRIAESVGAEELIQLHGNQAAVLRKAVEILAAELDTLEGKQ